MKRKISSLLVLCTMAILANCGGGGGGGGGGSSSSSSSESFGSCSSALSGLSTGTSSASFTESGSVSSITQTESCSSSLVASSMNNKDAGDIMFNITWEAADKEVFFEALASGENNEEFPDCAVFLPEPDQGESPSCFGPELYFQFHLDGDTRMSQDCDAAPCTLPTGDLGIWTDTEEQTGEACAAAKMNSDIQYVSGFTDMAKVVQAAVECLATKGTITRPSGNTETITDAVNTAVLNEKLEFSSVTWTESSGAYTINLQVGEAGADGAVNIKTDKSGDPDIINIWGFFANGGGDGDGGPTFNPTGKLAFSLYGTDDGTAKNIKMISGIFENSTPDLTTNGDDFDEDNMLKLTAGWTMDHRTTLINDPGDSTDKRMKYSWIAGKNQSTGDPDSYSRTFLASVNSDETSGTAYYGYGFGGVGGNAPADRLKITNFLCNWTGPGQQQAESTGVDLAQKQTIAKSSGVWTVTESLIDYAPTRSCANDNDSDESVDTRAENSDSEGNPNGGISAASSPMTFGLTTAMTDTRVISPGDVELVDISSMSDFNDMVDPTN